MQTYDYYPFGLEMPGRSGTGGTAARERFTGHERDEEVGLDYMQARRYAAEFGRFLGVDPLADEYPGWSPYNYAINNPVLWIDPTGLCPADPENDIVCIDGGELGVIIVTAQHLGSSRSLSFATFALGATRVGGHALVRTPNPYAVAAGGFLLGGALVADLYIETPAQRMMHTASKSIDWNNAPLSPEELSDEWSEVPSKAPNRREFVNERTGEEVTFDKGQPGNPGWAGRDHWHRKNPNSTSERDMYLDNNGNPIPRNHNRSHIPAGGK